MVQNLLNTIARLASANAQEPAAEAPPLHSRQQLIQWATGCMWAGLPDDFFSAWLEYRRDAADRVQLDYQCMLAEGSEVQTFQPADDLYPAQCIEKLDAFLPQDKRSWRVCRLEFSPREATVAYTY